MLNAVRSRNQGRGYARNGQANGQRFNQGSTSSKRSDWKYKKRFHPLVKGKHPEYSFDEVLEELVKSMEQLELSKADDIINSIYDMEYVDLDAEEPELEISVEPLRADRDAENKQFKEVYKRAMKKWDSRVEALSNNKHKLRSEMLEFCTETMEQKLKQVPNWDNELRRDPICILKKIKKFMTTSDETDWDFFVLWEALSKFINC